MAVAGQTHAGDLHRQQCAWPLLRYLVVPCLGLRLVIRQGVRKTIPWYCLAAETRSAELVDEYPGDPFPLRRQRPAGERERLSALVCGFNEHRRGGGAGAADGIALI